MAHAVTRRALLASAIAGAIQLSVAARVAAGPFDSAFGTDLPGVVTTVPAGSGPTLALTFDACGGPGGSDVDVALLDLLLTHQIPATLFLNQRWIHANRELTHTLAADPLFVLANHGTRHVPLSVSGRSAYGIGGTRSARDATAEVMGNQKLMATELGLDSRWFRSGTAHYDGAAVAIVQRLGLRIAGFAVNADAGATFTSRQVAHELLAAPSGAIVLCHMNKPGHGTSGGLAMALPDLVRSGTTFTHLPT